MASEAKIYQFKVTLKGIRPPIWRRIQVSQNLDFEDLHIAIQGAMGWCNCHLYQFRFGRHTLIQDDPDGMMAAFGDEVISPSEAKISDFFQAPKDKAIYEYDMGDGWEHAVVLEKILPAAEGGTYPKCIAGKRACPPEDCGGSWGYEELLKIIADPTHPEYEERMEWLDGIGNGGYDPEKFDRDAVFGFGS